MATSGNGRAPYKSSGSKRPFQPEINEEPQNVSQEAGQYNLIGVAELSTHQDGNSASIFSTSNVISELEQILKQNTFTRYETQHLIALLHSRTIEESPSDNFPAAISSSRVNIEEEIASPAEVPNAYKGSTIGTAQAPRQYPKLVNNSSTCPPKTPMASPQRHTTLENLPEELLLNIFVRLLARQLAQMRSVSKSWNALLSQSSFVKSHLHRSIHNNDQVLLHFSDDYSFGSKGFKPLNCQSPHLQDQLTNFIKLPPFTPPSTRTQFRLIGSVNGLICSSYGDSDIHIWNPSLSAVLTLPPYSIPSGNNDTIQIFFRFGFDPKTDDYKVVKLTGFTGPDSCDVQWWLDVEVYSMRKGFWEVITQRFPWHVTGFLEGDVVCADGHNGHLYWLCESRDSRTIEMIVAFDLGPETFHEIPLPHSIVGRKFDKVLGAFTGKLCVMSCRDGICELWVMEKHKSWVKRRVFSPFDGYPFGFTSRNDFLIQDEYGRLVLYPVGKQTKILDKDCSYEQYVDKSVEYVDSVVWAKILEKYCSYEIYIDKFVEYVDSLVWVAPAKREMVDGASQN